MRLYDEIFRYGGEEFLICLPSANAEQAVVIVDRLRLSLSDTPVTLPDGDQLPLTASFGLCIVTAQVPLKQTIENADSALYQAKDGGRNRLHTWLRDKPA